MKLEKALFIGQNKNHPPWCSSPTHVPTAHHGRRPIAMPTAKPMPMAIWPMPTLAYADGDVPTVAIGTDYADGIFSRWHLVCRHLVCVP
jgi:hypothetical protein